MANPIQSKVRRGILSLMNYPISKEMSKVLGDEIQADKEMSSEEIATLCLADNSMCDNSFMHVL